MPEYLDDLLSNIRDYNLADWTYERIVKAIQNFEDNIKDDEQASIIVPALPNQPLLIDDVGYKNPDIITFSGRFADGSYVELLQSQSQLNLCLIASKRPHPEKPRRTIGFSVGSQEE